jgi:negative regulator of sigma E activity
MASWTDKLDVLRRKKHLANTKFSKIGIEEDLTPKQAELKRASWPSFVKAKQDGKKTYWRAHVLFIDGKPVTPTSLSSQTKTNT